MARPPCRTSPTGRESPRGSSTTTSPPSNPAGPGLNPGEPYAERPAGLGMQEPDNPGRRSPDGCARSPPPRHDQPDLVTVRPKRHRSHCSSLSTRSRGASPGNLPRCRKPVGKTTNSNAPTRPIRLRTVSSCRTSGLTPHLGNRFTEQAARMDWIMRLLEVCQAPVIDPILVDETRARLKVEGTQP